MVSRKKRLSYVTESGSSSEEDADYIPYNKRNKGITSVKSIAERIYAPEINGKAKFDIKVEDEMEDFQNQSSENGKRVKCASRNAIIARKNRIRKKMYIQNLENEVSKLRHSKEKLNSVVNSQSFLINKLRKEVKYMKSVLANSSDICNLIKNIRNNTGMSVTTSLDRTLTMNNNCVSKRKQTIARKTAHPWENLCDEDDSNTLMKSDLSSQMDVNEDFGLLSEFTDLNIPLDLDIPFPDFSLNLDEASPNDGWKENDQNSIYSATSGEQSSFSNTWEEHNYTASFSNDVSTEDDVGVCLHVSQHKVSLEFCPSCSENATHTWKELE